MEKDDWKIGDQIYCLSSNNSQIIAKITDINDQTIKVNVYIKPDDIKGGRQYYHGKNEILLTNEAQTIPIHNIKGKCKIVQSLKEYVNYKHSSVKELKDVYIMRQKYNTVTRMKLPILESSCCKIILNPDSALVRCMHCSKMQHIKCAKNNNNICYMCGKQCTQILEKGTKITGVKGRELVKDKDKDSRNTSIGKRKYPMEQISITQSLPVHTINKRMKSTDKNGKDNGGNSDINRAQSADIVASIEIDNGENMHHAYKSLSEERGTNLDKLVKKLEKENATLTSSSNLTRIQKHRKTISHRFLIQLLIGVEEILEKKKTQFEKIGIYQKMAETEKVSLCKRIATEIETSLWITCGESLAEGNSYNKKFKKIYFNLRDTQNIELREAILSGNISGKSLSKMDANDLAPSKLKNLRDEREQKYLREQVLLDAPAGFGTIIAKSHKGEVILNDDSLESEIREAKDKARRKKEEISLGSLSGEENIQKHLSSSPYPEFDESLSISDNNNNNPPTPNKHGIATKQEQTSKSPIYTNTVNIKNRQEQEIDEVSVSDGIQLSPNNEQEEGALKLVDRSKSAEIVDIKEGQEGVRNEELIRAPSAPIHRGTVGNMQVNSAQRRQEEQTLKNAAKWTNEFIAEKMMNRYKEYLSPQLSDEFNRKLEIYVQSKANEGEIANMEDIPKD